MLIAHQSIWAVFALVAIAVVHTDTGNATYSRPPASRDISISHPLFIPDSAHAPSQVHLALAGEGRLAVSWVTAVTEDKDMIQDWQIRSGLDVHVNLTVLSEMTNYTEEDSKYTDAGISRKKYKKDRCKHLKHLPLEPTVVYWTGSKDQQSKSVGHYSCYQSSSYYSGALHTAILGSHAPLTAGTEYTYKVGDPVYGWSEQFTFKMPQAVGSGSVPYRLGLIGDLGQTEDSNKTLHHLKKLDVATVLNVGDLSYADSFQPRWDSWGALLQMHASEVPWMHIEGNHELEDIDGISGFVAYEERFYFPAEESESHSPFYYSYETGPAHIIMLGCYVDYSEDSEQAVWLAKDLAKVDRSRTPWLIVGMHAPWYNSNTAHQGEMDDMRAALEPLLYRSSVDVVFAGHVHAMERSKGGVLDGNLNAEGPNYIVIGDGGNREGLAKDYLDKPVWSGVREASFGMGVLSFMNDTHALWEWHRNQDEYTTVGDSHWFTRGLTIGTPVKPPKLA